MGAQVTDTSPAQELPTLRPAIPGHLLEPPASTPPPSKAWGLAEARAAASLKPQPQPDRPAPPLDKEALPEALTAQDGPAVAPWHSWLP